jgi:hypothetical protein
VILVEGAIWMLTCERLAEAEGGRGGAGVFAGYCCALVRGIYAMPRVSLRNASVFTLDRQSSCQQRASFAF